MILDESSRSVMIDGALLEAFLAFAEHGGFTRGAHALHVSQPALHAQVRRLEETLGRSLYRRVGRNVALTADGTEVLAFARQARDRELDLRARFEGGSERPITLAAGEGALLYLLGPALRQHRAHTRTPLRVLTRTGPEAIAALLSGEAQVAVASITEPPADVRADLLATVGGMALVHKTHALASRRSIVLADLGGEPLVVPPPGAPHRERIARALADAGKELRVAVEAQGWEPMIHFARLGLGIAVVNDFCRVPANLVAVRVRDVPPQRYHVLTRRTRPGEAVEALRTLVLETTR
jgi:DNA-binding transcriptional LysR family regulator